MDDQFEIKYKEWIVVRKDVYKVYFKAKNRKHAKAILAGDDKMSDYVLNNGDFCESIFSNLRLDR